MPLSKLIARLKAHQDVKSKLKAMTDKKALPLTRDDFIQWTNEIIDLAMVPADRESQRFAIADMAVHLNGTEDHKEYGYFVKVLRKTTYNQIALSMMDEIRTKAKLRLAEQEAIVKDKAKDPTEGTLHVLEKPKI